MNIERIELQGFRTFRDIETFDFTKKVGMIYLTGLNEDEPSLGANAAGKSSLWEGVCWVAYGVSSRGLKGPELASWNSGQGIYGHLRANGHSITRSWGPKNMLHLDGMDATQAEVDDALGVDHAQFLARTFISQHGPMFLDLGATAKTDLMASVLQLDQWLTRAKKADDHAAQLTLACRNGREDIARTEAKIDELRTTNFTAKADEWDSTHATLIRHLRGKIIDIEDEVEGHSHVVSRRTVELRRTQSAFDKAQEHRIAAARAHERLKDDAQRAFDIRRGKRCPTCGTELKPGVSHAHGPSADDVEDAESSWRAAVHTEKGAATARDNATVDLRKAERNLADAENDLKAERSNLASLKERENLYSKLAAEQAERYEETLDDLRCKVGLLEDLEPMLARAEFWAKAFKDVRLFLVAEALAHLEVETNSALVELGLHGWAIKYAPDAETKSGTVKRGFTVTIESPTNPRPVPWEVWSGGERQRLRIAGQMGLSNLITSYTGSTSFIEVWDEPSNGMSEEGLSDMLAAFASRARTNNRQVWVVDHRSFASGLFDSSIVAVKSGGTTKLETP